MRTEKCAEMKPIYAAWIYQNHLISACVVCSKPQKCLRKRKLATNITVRLLIPVLCQPRFYFSSLLSAVFVDLPRSCLVRTAIAQIGKRSLCNPPTISSFSFQCGRKEKKFESISKMPVNILNAVMRSSQSRRHCKERTLRHCNLSS